MKKILFYLHFTKIGGAEKVAMQYIQGLIERGNKVDLIIDFDMGINGNTFEYAIPKEVNYQYIKSKQVSAITYKLRTIGKKYKLLNILLYMYMILTDFFYYHTKVKKILQDGNYDWTISFYQFLPAYLTNIKSAKHIIWLHGSVEHFFGGITKLLKGTYGKKLDKYDYVITIADEMKEQLENYYPQLSKRKIKRIYNPFDFGEIRKKADDISSTSDKEKILLNDKYICTVTRLDEHQKDITTLIKSYQKLYNQNKIHHKLYIVGDGPHKNILKQLVNEYKLEEYILFLGKKYNPYIWMKNAYIFILSSKFEGLPTVVIESMSMNTFVISSKCKTGPKEILKDGGCGDLFDVGNVNELSKKIDFALSNEVYRKEKISKGYERIKEFEKELSIKKLIKIMENLK